MTLLLHALLVVSVQLLLYAVLPALALMRAQWRDSGEWWFASLVAGLSSAALAGWAGNESGLGVARTFGAWLLAWLIVALAVNVKCRQKPSIGMDGLLLAVVVLAWAVRMVHPLQAWALGQSDAYSHLGFLKDVLEEGRIGNGDYPPSYSWVLAFPAWIVRGEPYWMVRFGGAFFGMGMVLGVYALLSAVQDRTAAVSSAALLAGCPLFWLVQKTGVGCFANQLGLFFIPAALWAFATGRRGWLVMTLLALAVSVPMMLIHVLILIALLVLLEREPGGRVALLAIVVLAFVLALGIAMRIPADRGMVVASMLTGKYELSGVEGAGWGRVLSVLASDFIAVKRAGLDSWIANTMLVGSMVFCAAVVVAGWRRMHLPWRILGAWGFLTGLNLCWGLFQFTNYQREGWSLLIAWGCILGLMADMLWRRFPAHSWRGCLVAGISVLSLSGLLVPPRHAVAGGAAENDVVKYLLTLDPSVPVLARNMGGFASGQGDVVRTLHTNAFSDVSAVSGYEEIRFLRDRPGSVPDVSPVMKLLQPALAAESERARLRGERDNGILERQLKDRSVRVINYSPHLDIWHIQMDK